MLPEKDVPLAVVWTVGKWCLDCVAKPRVPEARSSGCKSFGAVTAECSRHHVSRDVSWPQRAPSAVGHEAAIICQVERRLPGQRLANQTCHFERVMLQRRRKNSLGEYTRAVLSLACISDQQDSWEAIATSTQNCSCPWHASVTSEWEAGVYNSRTLAYAATFTEACKLSLHSLLRSSTMYRLQTWARKRN